MDIAAVLCHCKRYHGGFSEDCCCVDQVAAEIAAPLSHCKKVTMVSIGKSEVGAAKLTNEILAIMERLPTVVEGLTGVNINKVPKSTLPLGLESPSSFYSSPSQ